MSENKDMRELSLDEMDKVSGGTDPGTRYVCVVSLSVFIFISYETDHS